MDLTHTQTGIIAASISATFIGLICASLLYWGQNLPFTFSRRDPPCTDIQMRDLEAQRRAITLKTKSPVQVEGEYAQYGVLFVVPDKKLTLAALDIITRICMCIGLPAKSSLASPRSFIMASATEAGRAPHLSLHFGPEFDVAVPGSTTNRLILTDSQVALQKQLNIHDMMREAIEMLKKEQEQAMEKLKDEGGGVPTIHVIAPTPPRQSVFEALRESAEATQRVSVAANALLARTVDRTFEGGIVAERSGKGMAQLYRNW
jgi:hypothetical protein